MLKFLKKEYDNEEALPGCFGGSGIPPLPAPINWCNEEEEETNFKLCGTKLNCMFLMRRRWNVYPFWPCWGPYELDPSEGGLMSPGLNSAISSDGRAICGNIYRKCFKCAAGLRLSQYLSTEIRVCVHIGSQLQIITDCAWNQSNKRIKYHDVRIKVRSVLVKVCSEKTPR